MQTANLPLNGLRAFEVAARHRSFSRAAGELGVTPAAVSHLVKELEARLGVEMFRRLPRGLQLTEAGAALLPDISEGIGRMREALDRLGPRTPRGKLTLSVLATFAISWLLPRLGGARGRPTQAQLLLLTHNNVLPNFSRDSIDFCILYGAGRWRGVVAEKLFDYHLTPLCSPAFRERLRTPRDLAGLPLLWNLQTDYWERWFQAAGLGERPRKVACFDSTRVTMEAAAQGLGIAIGSPFLFAEDLAQGRLVQPFGLELPSGKSYWLIRPEGRRPSVAARDFQDWLLTECRAR